MSITGLRKVKPAASMAPRTKRSSSAATWATIASAGERAEEFAEHLAQRRSADEVLTAQAVDADRLRPRHPAGRTRRLWRPGPAAAVVDGHRRERDDLVVGPIEAGGLQVEHA